MKQKKQAEPVQKKERVRRVSKNKNSYYFTSLHEKAITDYIDTDSPTLRSSLYIEYIGPVLEEMVDKIIYTYKFTSLPNIVSLREECKVWLVTVLNKFEVDKGYKAFSYFSVITKNWFIHKVKSTNQQFKREVQYMDIPKDIEFQHMTVKNDYIEKREDMEFWQSLREEIDNWDDENLKLNERKVLYAIKILFDNLEEIEIFNKKAFFLYIRELTSLSTKQIVNNLSRIKKKYKDFRSEWEHGSI
jgi:hypothetical protein